MRTTTVLLLAATLLAPVPTLAGGLGRQLLLEASLDSIDPLEDALELLETEYTPGEPVDPVTEGAIAGLLEILERTRFTEDLGVGVDFKNGVLGLRGARKELTTGGVRFGVALPAEFTLLVSLALPEKLRAKQLAALTGASAGVYLASDDGAMPASSFVVEHQMTPQGLAQSFVAQGPNVVATFPLGAANLERRLRTIVAKDADSIRLGLIQRDGEVEALHDVDVPLVGDLPFLSLYVRNATKKTRVEFDDLLILAAPHVVALPE